METQTLEAGTVYHDTRLPNSPQHQLYVDGEYRITANVTVGASLEHVSSYYIDATNRIFLNGYGCTDPDTLAHVRLAYRFKMGNQPWELFVSGRNIFNAKYCGFTEPDPDGNSYRPAATSEWSVGLRFAVGPKQ